MERAKLQTRKGSTARRKSHIHNRRRAHFMTKHVRPAVGGVAVENGDVGVAY